MELVFHTLSGALWSGPPYLRSYDTYLFYKYEQNTVKPLCLKYENHYKTTSNKIVIVIVVWKYDMIAC